MAWKHSIAIAAVLLLFGLAVSRPGKATDLTVAAGQPISCSGNSWIVVLMGNSPSEALIFCQLPGQDRVPLSRIKCPNESDRLRFTTNVVMSDMIVDGQRRPTSARFHCYSGHPSEKVKS